MRKGFGILLAKSWGVLCTFIVLYGSIFVYKWGKKGTFILWLFGCLFTYFSPSYYTVLILTVLFYFFTNWPKSSFYSNWHHLFSTGKNNLYQDIVDTQVTNKVERLRKVLKILNFKYFAPTWYFAPSYVTHWHRDVLTARLRCSLHDFVSKLCWTNAREKFRNMIPDCSRWKFENFC